MGRKENCTSFFWMFDKLSGPLYVSLAPLRLNDLTVAETELFRHPSWRSCRLSPYAQSIAPQCGEARPQRAR